MLAARALVLLCLGAAAHGGDWYEAQPVPSTFILTALQLQAAAPEGSSAFVRMDIAKDLTQSLVVRLLGLPAGSYDVLLDGDPIGTIAVDAQGLGQLAPEPPEFDTFFAWFQFQRAVEVRQGSDVLFEGNLEPPGGSVLLDDAVSCVNGVRLMAVGDDLDARGQLTYRSSYGAEGVDLRLERLAPGPYVVDVDGQPSLLVDVGAKGKARLRERVPVKSGFGATTIYPLGGEVRVRNVAGEVVLAARMPWDLFEQWSQGPGRQKFVDLGDGAADGLRVDFVRAGQVGDGGLNRGWLAWQRDALGAATLTVRVTHQDFTVANPYGLYVDDVLIGQFGTSTDWLDGGIQKTLAVGPELDLRTRRVELRRNQEVGLQLTFPNSVPAGVRAYRPELRQATRLRLDLHNPGIDLDATGRLEWRLAKSGAERLALSVRDLPAGSYDLAIDGAVVAADALLVAEDGGEASVLFSNAGLPESLPLDFTVHGALEIRASGTGTVYLLQSLAH